MMIFVASFWLHGLFGGHSVVQKLRQNAWKSIETEEKCRLRSGGDYATMIGGAKMDVRGFKSNNNHFHELRLCIDVR
jgi:hypothetical protein